MSRSGRVAFVLLMGGSIAACTLINSLDDVKPQSLAVTVGDGSVSEASTSSGGPTEGGAADVTQVNVNKGVIAIGGETILDGSSTNVLTALAPETGLELPKAREKMKVAAIRYDGRRDVWYIFESGGAGFFPQPTDPVSLHVRTLDNVTGQWTESDTLQVPPIVSFMDVVVLRDRLMYVAYRTTAGATVDDTDVITVDTTDPASVKVSAPLPLATRPVGVIGYPSQTQTGGDLLLLTSSSCPQDGAPAFCLNVNHFTVTAGAAPTSRGTFGYPDPFAGTPAFGPWYAKGLSLIGFKAKISDTTLTVKRLAVQTNLELPGTTTIGIIDGFIKPIVVDECRGIALICGTNQDLQIYAAPLNGGGADALSTDHSGQGVYYEPFTKTVLAPFSQGSGFTMTAMTLGGTSDKPTLTKRATDWKPPADLAPEIVATRVPDPYPCP